MTLSIDYYLTLISPYTYMGHEPFEALVKKHGVTVNYRPTDYGKVFPISGGLPVAKRAPQRQAYRMMELKRWREHLGIKFNLEPKHFPAPDGLAARVVIAAMAAGHNPGALIGGFLRAVWAEERNIADEATVSAIATENGLDGAALLATAGEAEAEAQREAFTQEAIDRAVFGAPTWIVNGELFWGQDRLDFLDRALAKATA